MPDGLIRELSLPAHRALPDAYVTAHHLRDMLNQTSLERLLAWSAEPGLPPRIPSGPERGKPWDQVDMEIVRHFLSNRDRDARFTDQTEITRRAGEPARERIPAQGRLL